MPKTAQAPEARWDRHAIKAELARRGLTLTRIAIEAGLYSGACRQALNGQSLAGAQAISKVLGIPVEELFPDRFTSRRRSHLNRNAEGSVVASPKDARTSDAEVAA